MTSGAAPADDITTSSPIWTPKEADVANSQIARFGEYVTAKYGAKTATYLELWDWSVNHIDEFWLAIWEFFGMRSDTDYDDVLKGTVMPDIYWFEGATLNYAEHALRYSAGPEAALIAISAATLAIGKEAANAANADEQAAVNKQLAEIYDFATAKTPAAKRKLAAEMYDMGKVPESNKPAERFVLLRKAAEIVNADRVLVVSHSKDVVDMCDARYLVADGTIRLMREDEEYVPASAANYPHKEAA